MPRPPHYSPVIDRFLVSCLYHEAKKLRKPMTVLVNQLLEEALKGTDGWVKAGESGKSKPLESFNRNSAPNL